MAKSRKVADRERIRSRINNLLDDLTAKNKAGTLDTQSQAHFAKYIAVLVSGHLEQAIKEILIDYSKARSHPTLQNYINKSWPVSRNMNADNILSILLQFDEAWKLKLDEWLEDEERRGTINSLVSWRNGIAHGDEANTTGVTLNSVRKSFKTTCGLIDYLDRMCA
ncbi:HEPN domain-containing protein [Agrobacterium deltaense]